MKKLPDTSKWTEKEISQGFAIRKNGKKVYKLSIMSEELKDNLNKLQLKGKKDNVEYIAIIKNNKIIGDINTLNDSNKVKLSDKQQKTLENDKEEYYVAHNHPINKPIEPFDLQIMDEYKNARGVIVTTDKNHFMFIRSDNISNIFDGINEYMYENIDKIKEKYPNMSNENIQYIGLSNAFKNMGGKVYVINRK